VDPVDPEHYCIEEVFLCVRYLDALCDVVEHVDGLPGDRVGNKKPTQKNPLKKPKKAHLKKPTKNVLFVFFCFFFNF
jgi:hypothetical protein